MKREFLNQDDQANKFWHVEQDGAQLLIHYGRVGTAGQQQTKQFASAEAAANETDKLVREKLRKGYAEQAAGAAVPDKPAAANPIVQELEHHVRLGLHPTADILETVSTDVDDGNFNEDGFNGYDFVESRFGGDDDRFEKWLRQQFAEQLKRQRAREASYPAVTDFDRLAAAFDYLNQHQLVALHGATDTQSGGQEMAWEAQQDDSAGYCFYHTQHLRGFDEPQQLYVYFGSYAPTYSDEATRDIGRRVVAALQAQGLAVEWDDSPDTGIKLPALHWQKRFDDQDWPQRQLGAETEGGLPGSVTIAEAVARLKDFVKALAKRKDVVLENKQLGRPAPAKLIAYHRQHPELLPAHVVDFYELMNGVNIAWRFVDDDGTGGLYIPELRHQPLFQTDDDNANDFGEGKVSAFFEATAGEAGTWLVADADAPTATAELRFAEQGEGDDGFVVAGTVAEYLTNAVAAGLADRWQQADDKAQVQEQIARILAPPVVVPQLKIRPGVRVQFQSMHGLFRGEVLETYTPTPEQLAAWQSRSEYRFVVFDYRGFALVRFDFGQTLWTALDNLKPLPKTPDAYERLRADPWLAVRLGEAEGWEKALRYLALAWDVGNVNRDDSWCVVGCLLPLPPAEAVALARQLLDGIGQLALPDNSQLTIPEAEQPLAANPRAWKNTNDKKWWWQFKPQELLYVLREGLRVRVRINTDAFTPEALADLQATLLPGLWYTQTTWKTLPFYHSMPIEGLPGDYLYTN